MKYRIFPIIILSLFAFMRSWAADSKQERNHIIAGNKLYEQQRYAEAETMYKKALTVSPSSESARFNLAATLIRQTGSTDPNNENTPLDDAIRLLSELEQSATTALIAERAAYNLGNISFNKQNYKEAIEHYKNALRKNPDNDKTRQNLRLAQKKLQEQQNKDKQNKDQNKDQQDQQKQQNQQDKQQNKDKQDNQQNQQQQPNNDKTNQQPPQQQKQGGGISDENAQKILKAMENEEAATRKKVEAKKQRADNARRRQVTRPW